MNPDDIAKALLIVPIIFVGLLMFLPVAIWAMIFRTIARIWRGFFHVLAWPILRIIRAVSRKP